MRKARLVVVLLMLASTLALAQTLTPGKYTGTMTWTTPAGKERTDQVEITIAKVDAGAVEGNVNRTSTGFCRGEVPVVGKLDGDKLTINTTKGDPAVKDTCGLRFDLVVDGQKLEGKSPSGTIVKVSK